MTITEKAAYIKGLADGLTLDKTTPEGKLIAALIDVVDDMALTIEDLEDSIDALCEDVDDITDYLVEEDEDDEEEEEIYEIVCPACGEHIQLAESVLDEGEMLCPACGEKLEFDFDCDCEDCDGDCDSCENK